MRRGSFELNAHFRPHYAKHRLIKTGGDEITIEIPANAHRQPRTDANVHRQCPHCHVLETAQHTYSVCDRYLNQRRLRHDHAIDAILPHLRSAAARFLSRATWVRERSLATLAPPGNDSDSDQGSS